MPQIRVKTQRAAACSTRSEQLCGAGLGDDLAMNLHASMDPCLNCSSSKNRSASCRKRSRRSRCCPRPSSAGRTSRGSRSASPSIRGELYSRLTPWQRVLVARHPSRPTTLDYIERLFTDFVEIRGDRRFADDHAIVCGMARYQRRRDPRRRTPEGQRHQAEDLPQLRLRASRGLSQGAARDAAGAEVRPRRSSASSTRRPRTPASSPRSAASPKRSRSTCARWPCSPCR